MIQRDLYEQGQKQEVLRLENVSTAKISKNISLAVNSGEVVGLFGQVGAGRTDILRVIFGADKMESGEIFLFGEKAQIKSPVDAIKKGIGFITEDRKNQGLILSMDLLDNTNIGVYEKSMRLGFIQPKSLRKITEQYRDVLKNQEYQPKDLDKISERWKSAKSNSGKVAKPSIQDIVDGRANQGY